MPRPRVLIATTDSCMALALKSRLAKPCHELGLRLDVCPEGEEIVLGGKHDESGCCDDSKVRHYCCAESLFDYLESRDPMELADTLVVLDVGAGLTNAFEPKAANNDGWHVTDNRAGIAVELILRFPQVFPVILSPEVPVPEPGEWPGNEDEVIPPKDGKAVCGDKELGDNNWNKFSKIQETLSKSGQNEEHIPLDSLFALRIPLHFVSPLDKGAGLESTLRRFARGMRCWFDPTGLRTLVKNHFLGTVFGSNGELGGRTPRNVLKRRLGSVAVAVDEEREFAMLNAYAAYKHCRRAWIVPTFGEFDDAPLWVSGVTATDPNDVVVIRDIDLRFPDIGDDPANRDGSEENGLRECLKDVESGVWRTLRIGGGQRLGERWRVRAVTSLTTKSMGWNWCGREKRLGQRGVHSILGLSKPLGTLYELARVFTHPLGRVRTWVRTRLLRNPALETVISVLGVANNKGSGGNHGAPYLNLAMSESLLLSARRLDGGVTRNLMAAFLAGEAYEMLLGMSKTTALEALLLVHKKEIAAEVEFPGVSHAVDVIPRARDTMAALRSLYPLGWKSVSPWRWADVNNRQSVVLMFLSQFWSEMRRVYLKGEQFRAAEWSNRESLIHGRWFTRLPILWPLRIFEHWINWVVIRIATTFIGWILAVLFLTLSSAVLYATLPRADAGFLSIMEEVALSSVGLQLSECLETIVHNSGHSGFNVAFYHLGFSYILFGVLVSMLYRKVTRG